MHYIHVLDSVHCKADKPLVKAIAPCLRYKRTHVRPGQFGAVKKIQDAYKIDRRNGHFLTGLLPRVCRYLDAQKLAWEVKYTNHPDAYRLTPTLPPKLNKGFILRGDQLQLIHAATQGGRGIIKAPTGTGKTVLTMGFLSQYPYHTAIILTHRIDLAMQFYDRMQEAGFPVGDIHLITEGNRPSVEQLGERQYAIATIQTFKQYREMDVIGIYDIVVGDEIHHCVDEKGMYATIFRSMMSPVKLGFTATLPPELDKALTLEGIVGPLIGELSIQEAKELGIMAEPHITLISVPYNVDIGEYRRYRDLYTYGIINNRVRNGLFMKAVGERTSKGQTCLMMVREIAHGDNLVAMAKVMGLPVTFIHGGTKGADRNRVRNMLNEGQIKCVITTDIWREGVDVPTLNTVANVCGGKGEIATLQVIGRGTRRTEEKDKVEILDALDPYRYLAEHTVKRLQIYTQNGWL
jgi:superfamily II DNA or RNA helicase